jgi:hypothetical protein
MPAISFNGVSKLVEPKAIPGIFAVCTKNSTLGNLVHLESKLNRTSIVLHYTRFSKV